MAVSKYLTTRQRIYLPFKRFFAIFFSILAILLIGWLLLILAIIIKCTSKGPIIFKQERIGKWTNHFYIYKFRTMRIDAPKNIPTHMLEDPDKYITKIGKFLRKTSLDELPQLFNILKGDMYFVGPRPALYNQDDLVAEREKWHANDIVPGMTGLAQVSGRDELPIPVKAGYDGIYFKKFNIWFDIKMCLLTVVAVFKHKGVKEGK
mgnify:FL=1